MDNVRGESEREVLILSTTGNVRDHLVMQHPSLGSASALVYQYDLDLILRRYLKYFIKPGKRILWPSLGDLAAARRSAAVILHNEILNIHYMSSNRENTRR